MNDRELPATSAAHLEAIDKAMSDDTYAAPPAEAVQIRNFTFNGGILPGWTFGRAREIDTGRGVRLIQANAQADGADSMARIEILESAGLDEGRALFRETLTRFQHDPASILCNPPDIGEAEACIGDGTVVFLRGNLVVTITSIAATGLAVEELAQQLDDWICEKPMESEDAAAPSVGASGKPMVKEFTRAQGRGASESYAVATDGTARRLPQSEGDD